MSRKKAQPDSSRSTRIVIQGDVSGNLIVGDKAETLPVLARRTRQDLLSDLESLAPVIHALGGEPAAAETFRAIQDVARWWP